MTLGESELILNPDGSIYHLNLLPSEIANTIITVGDPDRVKSVSKYFDSIEVKKERREFHTHTGFYKNKRLTVISTGIGTDNIDIVFNELDALANIDFKTRKVKQDKTQLDFIRIGTSGAVRKDISVDSFVLSTSAIGLEGLLHFYDSEPARNLGLERELSSNLKWAEFDIHPYAVDCDNTLAERILSNRIRSGITVTNSGFYGPQGRTLRIPARLRDFTNELSGFSFENRSITNLEMETAGIYGLAKLLGHRAISLNAILANRITGEFSANGFKTVDALIKYTLEKIIE
ncbi:nucleoside phosphorylase [Flagellimonas meridianipacifica]|uniref:Uridine phosphorylase n=1 Tax=Flagellimonas meridianipacifica TaxID=1080225 RepID=A0A2T0MBF4_9FLAO|nr:nucleoside phosphorylase [Allomuricauda pacifica]PRX54805.1 uridine phosphorylase [Allomuricauda pacifica]